MDFKLIKKENPINRNKYQFKYNPTKYNSNKQSQNKNKLKPKRSKSKSNKNQHKVKKNCQQQKQIKIKVNKFTKKHQRKQKKMVPKCTLLSKSESKKSIYKFGNNSKPKQNKQRIGTLRNTQKLNHHSKFESPSETKTVKNEQNLSKQLFKKLKQESEKLKLINQNSRKYQLNKASLKQSKSQNTIKLKSKKNLNHEYIPFVKPPCDTKQSTNNKSIKLFDHEDELHKNSSVAIYEKFVDYSNNHSIIKGIIKSEPDQVINYELQELNQQIATIDWLMKISFETKQKRQTFHLAITYFNKLIKTKIERHKLKKLGIVCLWMVIKKQQNNEKQFLNELMMNKTGLSKSQIVIIQNQISCRLNLNQNIITHCFWIDYFTEKWDNFIKKGYYDKFPKSKQNTQLIKNCIFFTEPTIKSYNIYRQLIYLVDHQIYTDHFQKNDKCKIVVATIYLIVRIYLQNKLNEKLQNKFLVMYEQFRKKASPIFKDKYNFNEFFNEYIVESCEFELGDIIGQIKHMSSYLNVKLVSDWSQKQKIINQKDFKQLIKLQLYSPNTLKYILDKVK